MIQAEWKKISSKPMLAVIVIVLMIIPTLYNVIFLRSMWDPYGSLDQLPVAIVNQDQAVTYRDKKIDIGNQFVKELEKNQSLDFRIVDQSQAREGLDRGEYYAIVTIPSNFSNEATSVFENQPRPMQLAYETSQGHNYTASKMSKSAIAQMDTKLSKQMSEMYFKTLLDVINQSTDGMKKFEEGTEQLALGATKLSNGQITLNTHLSELNQGANQLVNGTKRLTTGVQSYTEGVNQLATGQQTFHSHLSEIGGGVNRLSIGADQLVSGVQAYTSGVNQLASGQKDLTAGINQFNQKMPNLVNGLNDLSKGSETFQSKLTQYVQGVDRLSLGLIDFNQHFSTLTKQWPIMNQGLFALADGANTLNEGIGQYTQAVGQLSEGSTQLYQGVNQLNQQVQSLPQQAIQLNEGVSQMIQKIESDHLTQTQQQQLFAYINGVSTYIDSIDQWLKQMDKQQVNPNQIATMLQGVMMPLVHLNQSLQTTQASVTQLQANIEVAHRNDQQNAAQAVVQSLEASGVSLTANQIVLVQQAINSNNQVEQVMNRANSLNDLSTQLNQAQTGLNQLITQLKQMSGSSTGQLNQLKQATSQLVQSKQVATSGLNRVINGTVQIQNQLLPALKQVQQGTAQLQQVAPVLVQTIGQIDKGSQNVANGMSQLNNQSSALNSGGLKLTNGFKQTKDKLPQLTEGLLRLQQGSDQLLKGGNELQQNSARLLGGANQLVQGVNQIAQQGPTIQIGVMKLKEGSTQLSQGSQQLQLNSSTLTNGTNQLAQGISQMNEGVPKLIEGSNQLVNGSKQLQSNSPQLVNGTTQLAEGTNRLGQGVPQLLEGSNQLVAGAQTLERGTTLLHNKLKEASEQLALVPNTTNAQPMAQPIQMKHTDKDHVENNGMAMAPYMLSVALFIGALTTNMLYNAKTSAKKQPNAWQWWLSKMSVLMLIAVGQATIVYIALTQFSDFTPVLTTQTWLFLILEAMTFMSIVTVFDLYFGKIGDFLMLVFLIVQLAGSGGTYPIELSRPFYQAIHPFLPMTHGIRALRHTLSIGGSIQTEVSIFITIGLISQLLLALYYKRRTQQEQIIDSVPVK
ncbi:YhgE/Pip domain-containing protein [Atopobacter phocae]|uniref:YhgE/Pip domain-containing protein n=1 Tax=Atopobacter phocae TaxID=136492 RepID=UPI0004705C91|nr:YhgE/Pip domain-containing protein [Atopobacter phocae]